MLQLRLYHQVFAVAALAAFAHGQVHSWDRSDVLTSPPECSLGCLDRFIPRYCETSSNTTCACTNQELASAMTSCIPLACNITESLRFQRYSADSCGASNDRTRLYQQLQVFSAVPATTLCFVACRVFARKRLKFGLGADDWMIVAATSVYLATSGTGLTITLHGFGQHTYYLSQYQITKALEFFYIGEPLYITTVTLTKLALLLFFRRVFPFTGMQRATLAVAVFVVVSNIPLLLVLIFQCMPLYGIWTNWMYADPPVKCIDTSTAVFVLAALGILHDLLILALPIPYLWKLRMEWAKKLNILLMFSLGWFATACSLLRLPALIALQGSSDPSYDQAPIAWWSNVEMGVGIICTCLPACRSFLSYILAKFNITRSSSGRNAKAWMQSAIRLPGSSPRQDHQQTDWAMETFHEENKLPLATSSRDPNPT